MQDVSELRLEIDPISPFAPALTVAEPPTDSKHRRRQKRLARMVLISDVIVLGFAIITAHIARYILPAGPELVSNFGYHVYTVSLSVGLFVIWMIALALGRTRDPKILDSGARQYQAVMRSSFNVFASIAIVCLLLHLLPSRIFIFTAGLLGLSLLLLNRRWWRVWVLKRRLRGSHLAKALVIGGVRSAQSMTQRFLAEPSHGFNVVGVWVPDWVAGRRERMQLGETSVPILGTESNLEAALALAAVDAVVVTDTEHLGHDGMRELGWALEGRGVDLLVAPNVVDVAGPRVHLDAHGNMPLIYLSGPTYSRTKRWSRAIFDRTFALLALVGSSPVLLVAAVAIRLTSRGPILYRSIRIGAHGAPFEIYKLRTMVTDAEAERDALMPFNIASGPLFKMVDDPRVTKVGGVLRRWSIDEIPQFINVLKGDMSVVGPRPLLPGEVQNSSGMAGRRLLVKQGVTGAWQVSGRSDLSWEDSVRLDLDYVENWSMVRDLQIILQTVGAVLRRDGAY